MKNDLIGGITKALRDNYGGTCEIYADKDVKQGFKEPCFFVRWISSSRKRVVGKRLYGTHLIEVRYFPAERGNNREMREVSDRLYRLLEFVPTLNGDLVQGREMRDEPVDSVLHFFASYNWYMTDRDTNPQNTMDDINMEVDSNG